MRSTRGQRPRQTVEEMKLQRAPRNREIRVKRDRERLEVAAELRSAGLASRPTTREGMIAAGLIKVS